MITPEQAIAIYKISLLVYKERRKNNILPLIDKPSFENKKYGNSKRSKNN
jgi:hypothetical protein